MTAAKNIVTIDTVKAFEETYTLRIVGGGASTSIPKTLIEQKAKELKLTFDEFVEQYSVKMLYGSFEGIDGAFKFVKNEPDNGKGSQK